MTADNKKILGGCFFGNFTVKNTPEILQHNYDVLNFALSDYPNIFSSDDRDFIVKYMDVLHEMIKSNNMNPDGHSRAKIQMCRLLKSRML